MKIYLEKSEDFFFISAMTHIHSFKDTCCTIWYRASTLIAYKYRTKRTRKKTVDSNGALFVFCQEPKNKSPLTTRSYYFCVRPATFIKSEKPIQRDFRLWLQCALYVLKIWTLLIHITLINSLENSNYDGFDRENHRNWVFFNVLGGKFVFRLLDMA